MDPFEGIGSYDNWLALDSSDREELKDMMRAKWRHDVDPDVHRLNELRADLGLRPWPG